MLADNHLHTKFSVDGGIEPEIMIQEAIRRGIPSICITDHMDKDYFADGEEWIFDLDNYFYVLSELKEKYQDQIELRIGMELGMQPHLSEYAAQVTASKPFDYIIGSIHCVNGGDPYYPEFFDKRSDKEAYRETLIETIKSLNVISDFDVLGHLDYVVRYGKKRESEYSYREFADEIDVILKHLITNGKGLEINTAGWKYGLPFAHPHPDVLKRYKELGGEIITLGSDAHRPEHIGYDFQKARELLVANGFLFCTEFKERKPVFSKIC